MAGDIAILWTALLISICVAYKPQSHTSNILLILFSQCISEHSYLKFHLILILISLLFFCLQLLIQSTEYLKRVQLKDAEVSVDQYFASENVLNFNNGQAATVDNFLTRVVPSWYNVRMDFVLYWILFFIHWIIGENILVTQNSQSEWKIVDSVHRV